MFYSWVNRVPQLYRDSRSPFLICSKIHCYLLPFVYPVTARLDKFIHQNSETFFPAREDNREHGTAQVRYCYRWIGQDEIVPVVFNFRTCPRRRGTTHRRQHIRFAEHIATAPAYPLECLLELRQRTLYYRDLDATLPRHRTQGFRHHLQAGEGLGRGECPPVRAFTLPT